MFDTLGTFIYRHRWSTLFSAGIFLVLSILVLFHGGELTSGTIHGLESEEGQHLADGVVGRSEETTLVTLFRSVDLDSREPEFREAMRTALEPIRDDPRVLSVTTSGDAGPFLAPRMVNGPAHTAFALIALKGDFKNALKAYPDLRGRLHSDRLTITCTGQVPFMFDLGRTLQRDLFRAELLSLPLALIVLCAVFGTVVAAIVPVGVGALAVVGGIALVTALSRVTEIAQYTINVCSLIGLGVAIDYSLFTVSRYREELAAGHGFPEALRRSMATTGRVIAFSGLAVGTGLAGLLFFRNSYLLAMGLGGAIVVFLAVIFALTFLPALLAVLGPLIDAGRLPLAWRARGNGIWRRMATWVMARPLRVLVPTLAILFFAGWPFFHLRLVSADVRVLPSETQARQGYDAFVKDFPEEAANRIIVSVRFPTAPALNTERIGALFDLSRRIESLPHVKKVESIVNGEDAETSREDYQRYLLDPPLEYAALVAMAKKLTVGDDIVLLSVVTDEATESEAARNIVRTIRKDRSVADGALLVGGRTARDLDATDYILARAPRAVGFVIGTTVVIFFLLFGSVILPLKAVVMNFFSIAGSFGALVWIFQDGHLFIHEPRPLEPSLPILLFCILFGLSMDYEVLILSRIKESFDRSGDNTHAVADGLEKTAGLITSAAAIMVVVFIAFALASVVLIQAVGVGMTLAVAIDATLVRVLLVPATMRLFGRFNWWAPRWLVIARRLVGLEKTHS